MREIVTHGDICLKDEYNLVYKVADYYIYGAGR